MKNSLSFCQFAGFIFTSVMGTLLHFAYDLSNFKWVHELNKEPYYYEYYTFFDGKKLSGTHDDLISVSRQTQKFVKWTHAVRTNQDEMVRYVMTNAANLTAKNITSHFEGLICVQKSYQTVHPRSSNQPVHP